MGIILNSGEAVIQKARFNLLHEPFMVRADYLEEEWKKSNPIDLLFNRTTIDRLQETRTSSVGYNEVMSEMVDGGIPATSNAGQGFSKTVTYRDFSGGFEVTRKVIREADKATFKRDSESFMDAWHADQVNFALSALSSGLGVKINYGTANGNTSVLQLKTKDTISGDVNDPNKQWLFSNAHKTPAKKDGTGAITQSNKFYVDGGIDLGGSDPGQLAKLANILYQIKVDYMENNVNDTGRPAGIHENLRIVIPNDALLKQSLTNVMNSESFNYLGQKIGDNLIKDEIDVQSTVYLNDKLGTNKTAITINGATVNPTRGIYILAPSASKRLGGPELIERYGLTLDVEELPKTHNLFYGFTQGFDVDAEDWRPIAYLMLDVPTGTAGTWNDPTSFTKLTAISTLVKPVSVVNLTPTPTPDPTPDPTPTPDPDPDPTTTP